MWIAFSLTAALGAAATSLALKRTVETGGAVISTAAFRIIAGLVLTAVVFASGSWPTPTPAYWRTVALVIPPEVGGMICLTLALRAGDLSMVQPMMGLIPLLVMVSGFLFLGEVPTPWAATGIVFVTAGVYCVGLQGGGSPLEPLRALARTRASWYALAATVFWTMTTILHKIGIAEVGPFPWAVTLALGSGLVLAASLPFLAWKTGGVGLPVQVGPWARLVALTGLFFALQQIGLHLALRAAQAGYVVAVNSTSILLAIAFGIVFLGERSTARTRVIGGVLVSTGAVLIALLG